MNIEDCVWYIVLDDDRGGSEVFNSKPGAEGWAEEHGGTVVRVKEVKNDT